MLKVYEINVLFPLTPLLPLKQYVLYTRFNVDNYGWLLSILGPLMVTQNQEIPYCVTP